MEEKLVRIVEVEPVKIDCAECGNHIMIAIEDGDSFPVEVYCDTCFSNMKDAKEELERKLGEIHDLSVSEV